LLELINDILDLSKVEAGKMELERSEFSLKELLEGSLFMFKEKAMKHGIKLTTDVPENLSLISGDERKIKQVVFNLLSNAMKFTPDGGSVGIKAEKSDDNVRVTVWDTGIGIKPEEINKLFKPFQQLDSTLSKTVKGTGLGLNLSMKFLELHDGRIWVESEYGKGSRFIFEIPRELPPIALNNDEVYEEKCYGFLGCDKHDCIMYGRKDKKHCWEVEGTLACHKGIQVAREKFPGEKEKACDYSGCIYYKEAKERGIV